MTILDPLNGVTHAEQVGNVTRMGSRPESPVGSELVQRLPTNELTKWFVSAIPGEPDSVGLYRTTLANNLMDPWSRTGTTHFRHNLPAGENSRCCASVGSRLPGRLFYAGL